MPWEASTKRTSRSARPTTTSASRWRRQVPSTCGPDRLMRPPRLRVLEARRQPPHGQTLRSRGRAFGGALGRTATLHPCAFANTIMEADDETKRAHKVRRVDCRSCLDLSPLSVGGGKQCEALTNLIPSETLNYFAVRSHNDLYLLQSPMHSQPLIKLFLSTNPDRQQNIDYIGRRFYVFFYDLTYPI